MKLCFELRADDGRALILDLFHRLARRLRKTKISSHAAPTVEICLMTLAAGTYMKPVPRDALQSVLRIVTETHCRVPATMRAYPTLWSAVYAAWQAVDPARAEACYMQALKDEAYSAESFFGFITASATVQGAVKKLRDMQRHGFPATTRVYNHLILVAGREEYGAAQQPERVREAVDGVLRAMLEDALRPDDQTLGCVVSVYRRHGMGEDAALAVASLRDAHGCTPNRDCLTAAIAAQTAGCGSADEEVAAAHVRRAEAAMVEILERRLLNDRPAARGHHCFGRLMQCYAAAGDVAKLEALRDGFVVHIRAGRLRDNTARLNPVMNAAYREAYRAAAARAAQVPPPGGWGGALHAPWVPADADATLAANAPDPHLEMWP
eukprot:TRINITY_DN762_c0_g1_i4.p1 TRINITY_DN762_c0_g1~~TRINITY_DN762_c0_g1_i4.p1  ORF type:complete len:380 (+),score=68.31 TRINITY_DN762_c0_g1_i4:787-1926(+)